MSHRRPILVCLVLTLLAAAGASTGDKVLSFAQSHLDQQVGDGECATLAAQALKSANARRRGADSPNPGDYVWGRQVLLADTSTNPPTIEGKLADLQPGDIIQFRDAKFEGRRNRYHYTMTIAHHTAIIESVDPQAVTIKVLHQNYNGKRTVQQTTLYLNDLKQGWLRVYRPIP